MLDAFLKAATELMIAKTEQIRQQPVRQEPVRQEPVKTLVETDSEKPVKAAKPVAAKPTPVEAAKPAPVEEAPAPAAAAVVLDYNTEILPAIRSASVANRDAVIEALHSFKVASGKDLKPTDYAAFLTVLSEKLGN
jgi:septal ring-binding cell division protein DamX